jgi:hypothetical protein
LKEYIVSITLSIITNTDGIETYNMIGLCLLDPSSITLPTITELVNKITKAEKKVSTAKR